MLREVAMLVRAPGVSLTQNFFVKCKTFNLLHSGTACDLPVENDVARACMRFPKCVNQENQVRSVNYPRLSYDQGGLKLCLLALCLEPSYSVESLTYVRVYSEDFLPVDYYQNISRGTESSTSAQL